MIDSILGWDYFLQIQLQQASQTAPAKPEACELEPLKAAILAR